MKVICDRGALVEALTLVEAVALVRTPKPVLTCVKLTAGDNVLSLSATDLESAIHLANHRVEVSKPGTLLAPAAKLSQIVRESVDATLTLESDEEALHIRGQDSHFKILTMPVEEFPPIPEFKGEPDFEIEAQDLSQVIHQTIYATARENSRYAINGVLLEREGNRITVVATDGHRLAVAKTDCKGAKGAAEASKRNVIIPTKALNLLLKLLGTAEKSVRVKAGESQILFAADGALLASTLVEGNFPPYKDVIPRDGDKKATLATDALASAFRRAQLLTNEESKGVRMNFKKDKLVIASRAPEMGEAEISVDLPAYEGEPVEIGFNPQYVLDALKVVGADQVTIDLRASNKPGVIRSAGNFLYVVMPVNLQ